MDEWAQCTSLVHKQAVTRETCPCSVESKQKGNTARYLSRQVCFVCLPGMHLVRLLSALGCRKEVSSFQYGCTGQRKRTEFAAKTPHRSTDRA